MDIYQLISQRQSDRAFSPQRIEREVLDRIAGAALLSPSACNSQPWHLIVVDDEEKCAHVSETLTSIGMNTWASQAAAHIIIVEECPNFTARVGGWLKNKHFPHIDCGILAANITLAATHEGVGSCIVGWFNEKHLKKVLDIPSGKRVLLDIVLGYSTQPHRNKSRKPRSEVLSHNKY